MPKTVSFKNIVSHLLKQLKLTVTIVGTYSTVTD